MSERSMEQKLHLVYRNDKPAPVKNITDFEWYEFDRPITEVEEPTAEPIHHSSDATGKIIFFPVTRPAS